MLSCYLCLLHHLEKTLQFIVVWSELSLGGGLKIFIRLATDLRDYTLSEICILDHQLVQRRVRKHLRPLVLREELPGRRRPELSPLGNSNPKQVRKNNGRRKRKEDGESLNTNYTGIRSFNRLDYVIELILLTTSKETSQPADLLLLIIAGHLRILDFERLAYCRGSLVC